MVTQRPRRILCFAEAVTLAHVARPLVLARRLAQEGHELHFAVSKDYAAMAAAQSGLTRHTIQSLPSAEFLNRLARGSRVYTTRELEAYVEQDLGLLKSVKPDLVLGDFRLSLSVSARLAGVPYLNLTNAYWSPYARPRYVMPRHPLVPVLGAALASTVFRFVRPAVFAFHSAPLNRVRNAHGLRGLGLDLRTVYTEADITFYADVPELIPTHELPPNHHYLGPVTWSPPVPLPSWWQELPGDRPLVYLSMGSSGAGDRLTEIVMALSQLPITVVVATAGRFELGAVPDNVHVAEYLPGDTVAARARLVICNGGSPATQQALQQGVPVLGLPDNLDQYLNMNFIVTYGAGRWLRADAAGGRPVQAAVADMLAQERYSVRARAAQSALRARDAGAVLARWVNAWGD